MGGRFPLRVQYLHFAMYVNDTFIGADDLVKAGQKMKELISLLASTGINLHKWAGNDFDFIPASAAQIAKKQID